jgi:phage FluMu protein Com
MEVIIMKCDDCNGIMIITNKGKDYIEYKCLKCGLILFMHDPE